MASGWSAAGNMRGPQGPPGNTGNTGNTGAPGADGAAGLSVLNGAGAPAAGTGRNGEFYVDMTNARLYGPKAAGAWPASYVPLSFGPLLHEIRTGSVSASLTSNAADGGSGRPANIVNLTVTGNVTINGPTNPADGQVMRYRCVASGAQRTVTFGSNCVASTGLTLGPFTVPRGTVLIATLEYVGIRQTSAGVAAPMWVLTAATVSA